MVSVLAVLAAGSLHFAELELGGGVAHSLESHYLSSYPPVTPAVQARVAVGLHDRVSLGASFLAVIGEMAGIVWTNVEQASGTGCCNAPARSGLWTPALLFLASIGFSIAP
jgi:hypothetical protein